MTMEAPRQLLHATLIEGDRTMAAEAPVIDQHIEAQQVSPIEVPSTAGRVAYWSAINTTGQEYFKNGMNQLDNLGYEEREAKAAMAIALLLRTSVLLSGPAGGLKSTLSETAWQLFSDIGPDELALVPTAATLKDYQMVGGTNEVKLGDGSTDTRTVIGIFNALTKYGWVDEGNRVGPFAMNSILDLPEKHKLKVLGEATGYVEVPEFQGMAITINPSDSEDGLFRMTKAMVARNPVGVVMGRDLSPANRTLLRNSNNTSGIVEHITDTATARSIEAGVIEMDLPEKEDIYLDKLETKARELLQRKYGIVEGPRITKQLGLVAKTMAVFNGGSYEEFAGIHKTNPVRPVVQATRFLLGSRIGGLASSEDIISEFDETMEEVLKETRI